jgi:Cft2 family RNA processing exonuclease
MSASVTRRRSKVDVTVIDRTNHHLFQPLLYLLAGAFQRKILPPIPIGLDSPMAIKATEIYVKHAELFDEDASASLGGAIVQGQKDVKVLGEAMRVNAKVHTLGGLSGHAGRTNLLRWFDAIAPRPRVVLTHGEDKARTSLARDLAERHGIEAELPGLFDVIEDRPAAEMGADRWHGSGAWRLEGDRR